MKIAVFQLLPLLIRSNVAVDGGVTYIGGGPPDCPGQGPQPPGPVLL